MSKELIECLEHNKEIEKKNLAIYTWGNVSVRKNDEQIYIKPSGISFKELTSKDISLVNINSGTLVSGKKESVDTPMHLEIYKAYPKTRAVIHTHSTYASSFAQAKETIPLVGTTHADYFSKPIPVAYQIKLNKIAKMETLVGLSVVKTAKRVFDKDEQMAVLIPCHGPVIWSSDSSKIIEYAVVLEEIAKLAHLTYSLKRGIKVTTNDKNIFNFHYMRKHGRAKYYGQDVRHTKNT